MQQPIIESTCRDEQITRNNTLSIDYKQRPFQLDESRRNRESSLDSQLESQLNSREDRESRANLLLNGTVEQGTWRLGKCVHFNRGTLKSFFTVLH